MFAFRALTALLALPALPALLALPVPLGLETAAAQTPLSIVKRGLEAMGGEQAARRVRSVAADYYVAAFALGQSETAESPPRATLAYGRVTTDWASNLRTRTQELRAITGAVQRTRRVSAGGIGMLETDGRQAPDGAAAVAGVERAMRREPERLLLTALDNPGALSALPARAWRGEPHDGVGFALGPDTLSLYFDRGSGLLTVLETVADDPILGDRRTATWLTRWEDAGGIRLPRQADVTVNGLLQQHWVMTGIAVHGAPDTASFGIPDSIAARATRSSSPAPPIAVQLVELAPGVWRAEGGSHHSLVVEQPGQLVVVEAPQGSARAQAVLDTLRARFPGKPVGLVVSTHHHWDHAGGLRTIIAAGIPVATHRRNAAFVREIARARKTVSPDELSRRPRAPALRLVDDSLTVGEGDARVVAYVLPTAHVQGMVAAYVPSARVYFTSDVLPGGATPSPAGSAEVMAAVRALGIVVERVAGGHGAVLSWAEVERAAAR